MWGLGRGATASPCVPPPIPTTPQSIFESEASLLPRETENKKPNSDCPSSALQVGKDLFGLTVAKGLAQHEGSATAMLDTKRGSGELYSGPLQLQHRPVGSALRPQTLPGLDPSGPGRGLWGAQHRFALPRPVRHRVRPGYQGPSGQKQQGVNDLTAQRFVTPEHNDLVDVLLGASCHVIATMRTKTTHEAGTDDKGRIKLIRVGLAPMQRDGQEYPFTTVLGLSVHGHIATAGKDRTGLFHGRFFVLDGETARPLSQWLDEALHPEDGLKDHIPWALVGLALAELEGVYWAYAADRPHSPSPNDLDRAQLEEPLRPLSQGAEKGSQRTRLREVLSQQAPAH